MKTICCTHTGNLLVNFLNYFVNTDVFPHYEMDEIAMMLTPNNLDFFAMLAIR